MSLALVLALVAVSQPSTGTATLTVTLTPTTSEDAVADTFEVIGNAALPESVYRALVNLPEDTRPSARTARQAKGRILRFLKLAGYELARVDVKVDGKKLLVLVDEGKLERYVFLGQTGFNAMRFQLMLDLPGRVFNRPELEKQLDQFRREENLHITEYTVLPVRGATTAPGQVPTEFAGVEIVPEQGTYELHIRVEEVEYSTGLGLELRGESPDGLVTALRYRFGDVFADGDRLEAAGAFGFRPQKVFGGSENLTWISRGGGRVGWISPELFEEPMRVIVRAEGMWYSRARNDLMIDRYDRATIQPTVRLLLRPSSWVELEAGGGAVFDQVLKIDTSGEQISDERPRLEPIAFANARFSLGQDEVRLDRRHDFRIGLTQNFGKHTHRTHVTFDYDKSIGFGWNDLVFSGGLAGVFGERPYYAVERAGARVKGAYGDRLYAWAIAAAGIEYRWSLVRENLKVGVAYDAAGYARDLGTAPSEPGFVNAISLGLHVLFLNSFRMSFYVLGAIAVGEDPEPGLSLSLRQVF